MFKHWLTKFQSAFRGVWLGITGHSSFLIHLPATAVVLLAAYWLRCSGWQWSILGLCIALVWSLELVNSALEHLARGLCTEHNTEVGKALDTASAAVLMAALAATCIGLSILGYQLVQVGYAS